MAPELPYGYKNLDPEGSSNADEAYGYYDSLGDAYIAVPLAMRKGGRTVGIKQGDGSIIEYWWENDNDLTNGGLVVKTASGIEPNEVIQIGLIEIIDDSGDKYLKIAETPNPKWRINGTVYTRTTESLTLIPFAATNKYRVDIFVGNVSSDIQRIEGVEDDDVGVPPAIPDNTVEITRVNIFGNEIGDPSSPPTGGFIKKASKKYRSKNITNPSSNVFFLDADNTTFWVQAGFESIVNGFTTVELWESPDGEIYDGMDIYINNKGAELTLKHNDGSVPIPFYFSDEVDFVLQSKKIVHLKLNKTNNRVEMVGVASGGVNELQYNLLSQMLLGQGDQLENQTIRVDDASADTNLIFPTGANKVAYYKYNGVAGSPASIDDYTLISAPYGIVTNKDRIMATSGDITKADFGKIIYTTGTSITAAIDVSVNMLPESFECFFYNDNETTDLTFTFEPVAGWTFPTLLTLQPKSRCALVRVGNTQTLKLIGNDQ